MNNLDESHLPLHRQRPSWSTLLLPALFLIILTFGIYTPALYGPWLFDDAPALLGPTGIIQKTIAAPLTLLQSPRPLTDASFALNAVITGTHPMPFRIVNIALHIFAGLVLLDLLRRSFCAPVLQGKWVHLALPLSITIAGLWMVHPIQTQAVSYIVQRGEVMASLMIFLALDALAMSAGAGRCAGLMRFMVVVLCIAAMLCKPIGFLSPILVLLYDRCFWAGSFKACFKERPVVYIALILTLALPWFMGLGQLFIPPAAGTGSAISAGLGTRGWSPMLYFFSEQSILVHYLQLILWPGTLVLDDRYHLMEPAILTAWPLTAHVLSLSIMITLGIWTLWALWRKPVWGFLGAWFFLLMAPTSSFLPLADLAMEHRLYATSAGVITAVVIAVTLLFQWVNTRWPALQTNMRLVWMLVLILLLGALSVRTANRNRDYASALRIWSHVHRDRPSNTRAMLVLGKLLEPRQPAFALELYQRAARLEPANYEPMINLGSYYLQHNQPRLARKWYVVSYRLSGDRSNYLLNMGLVAQESHDMEAAVHYLTQAQHGSPDNPKIMTNLGAALDQLANERLTRGDATSAMILRQQAVALQRKALAISPDMVEAKVNLATSLVNLALQLTQAGQGAKAVTMFEQSLSVQPRASTARRLAWLLATWPEALTQDWPHVVDQATQASNAVQNSQPMYLDTLAAALARSGRFDEAVKTQQKAIDLALSAGVEATSLTPYHERLALYQEHRPYLQKVRP